MTDSVRPSRRRVLIGLGLGTLTAATLAGPGSAVAAAPANGAAGGAADAVADPPECLADLVASGEVTRGDYLVG